MKDLLTVIWYALKFMATLALAGALGVWFQQTLLDAHVNLLTAALAYGALGLLVTLAVIAPAFLSKPKHDWG